MKEGVICLNLLVCSNEIVPSSGGPDLTGWTGISVDRTGGVTRDNFRHACHTPSPTAGGEAGVMRPIRYARQNYHSSHPQGCLVMHRMTQIFSLVVVVKEVSAWSKNI